MTTNQEKEPGKNGNVWRIVFVVSIVVLACSLFAIGAVGISYWQGQTKYNEVAKTSNFDVEDITSAELADVNVDWNALLSTNPDTVAWIYIPGTDINYPIVQGPDNDYYLSHDFDGDAGWLANFGTCFMDFRNDPKWGDQQYFFYGHHMNDGSMFADLAELASQKRFDECRTIYLLTPEGNFKLRSFAMLDIMPDDSIVEVKFDNPEDMAAYLQDKIDHSVTDPGDIPLADAMGKSFAFVTCDSIVPDGRYILYAYVEEASADGLTGTLGLAGEGESAGFANKLTSISEAS